MHGNPLFFVYFEIVQHATSTSALCYRRFFVHAQYFVVAQKLRILRRMCTVMYVHCLGFLLWNIKCINDHDRYSVTSDKTNYFKSTCT